MFIANLGAPISFAAVPYISIKWFYPKYTPLVTSIMLYFGAFGGVIGF